jgi:CheY-like chemotaxis protein
MPMTLEKPRRRVAVADDIPDNLSHKSQMVELAGFEAVPLSGHFQQVKDLLGAVERAKASALVCDHKLTEGNYAGFEGVEAVAKLYGTTTPGILVTDYGDSELRQSIRKHKRRVPVLIKGTEFSPRLIVAGIDVWEQEVIQNDPPVERRPRRTAVMIDAVERGLKCRMLTVFVPRWREHEAIALSEEIIPEHLRPELNKGRVLLANVNTEAERIEDLYFDDFEMTPDEDLTREPA